MVLSQALGTKSKWKEDTATDFLESIKLLYQQLDDIHLSVKKLESPETVKNLEFYKVMQDFEIEQKGLQQKKSTLDNKNQYSLSKF